MGENGRMNAEAEIAAWARRHFAVAELTMVALPAEASTRSFFRLFKDAATYVAMHSPPTTEDNPRFVRIAELLREQGLGVPKVLASDLQHGYLLLEDLGRRDFESAYADGEIDAPLTAAIDALATLQSLPTAAVPPYARQRFATELSIFAEWLVERLLDMSLPSWFAATAEVLVEATQSVPTAVVHRDFHCRNLIWRDDCSVGIVDFQDALAGPVCYDVASLLRDCYHVFDEPTVAHWRQRFFERVRPRCDEATFNRAFDLTALQRQLKAVGIFARLHLSHGRDSHLGDIVPVLRRIAEVGRHYAETTALARWLVAEVLPRSEERLAQLSREPLAS